MMTRRIEEVPTVRRVDIEENTRNNDGLFFQQFLKESLASQGARGLFNKRGALRKG